MKKQSVNQCRELCLSHTRCKAWKWTQSGFQCTMFSKTTSISQESGAYIGFRKCPTRLFFVCEKMRFWFVVCCLGRYKYFSSPKNYNDAISFCQSEGGDLAIIESFAEHAAAATVVCLNLCSKY